MTKLVLLLLLAADGGTPTQPPPNAPVVEVAHAEATDGGQLPDGWWVSRPHMQKVGARLITLEDALKAKDAELQQCGHAPKTEWGFWAGMAAGAIITGAAVYGVSRLVEK